MSGTTKRSPAPAGSTSPKASSAIVTLKVASAPDTAAALTNMIFVHPDDYKSLELPEGISTAPLRNYVKVKRFIFCARADPRIAKGAVGFSAIQRRVCELALNEELLLKPYKTKKTNIYLGSVKIEVDYLGKPKGGDGEFDVAQLEQLVKRAFMNQFFAKGQKVVADVSGFNLVFTITKVDVLDLESLIAAAAAGTDKKKTKKTAAADGADAKAAEEDERGVLMEQTFVTFEKAPTTTLKLTGAEGQMQTSIFKGDFNFEELGIGGLDSEFAEIFKRAFVPRIFPMSLIKKMGMRFVKGILLYGPPGTGKTLMARQIAKMLNSRSVQVIDGPSILNKYVGQSEENIRNLFKEAEAEQKSKGDESGLHVIIFDEIDAIAAQRGSRQGGSGVGDTVVNQLLAKMDGVEELQNILVIGMTNRKDMIDEALLRPGRFEVHIEVNLPDEHGRLQIFQIHTKTHRANNLLAPDVDLEELAKLSKNFSGSEIKGLIDHASQIALSHKVDVSNPSEVMDPNTVVVTRNDFMLALSKTKPQFGVSDETLDLCMSNGIVNYGPTFEKLLATGQMFIDQVKNSDRTPLVSVLLEGALGSGKTAVAAKIASESNFPLVKMISPDNTVGMSEGTKMLYINRIFEDAYKSPESLVIIDDIERLLEYVRIGPRFSNGVLQTLMVLLKKRPPKNRKLLILATSSNRNVLEDMEILPLFDATLRMPTVKGAEVKPVLRASGYSESDIEELSSMFGGINIPIKQLIMISEMAKQGTRGSIAERFRMCLLDYGYGGAGNKLSGSE